MRPCACLMHLPTCRRSAIRARATNCAVGQRPGSWTHGGVVYLSHQTHSASGGVADMPFAMWPLAIFHSTRLDTRYVRLGAYKTFCLGCSRSTKPQTGAMMANSTSLPPYYPSI
ncbi:hypothetical protein P879_04562 [Paragonimus westermani]|uniref:Uncharacterized protein n=1 Tax=Paragonimus westermani TaxID=34504 RepID=A0A8T0DPB5_9TREM|nr:hypothetical protein P879_04562 [Paragonimus westermani]